MGKRKQYDWAAIEKEYRLGVKSMRTIADEFGINVSNISRRAKAQKWAQDKSEEVKQRTRAALVAQQNRNTPSREDVDLAVKTNVTIIREHCASIVKGRTLVQILSNQLESAATNRDELEDQIISDTEAKDGGGPDLKRRNALMKAVALPTHAGVLRDLTAAMKNLIPLERQAIGIDNDVPLDDPAEFNPSEKKAIQQAARNLAANLRRGGDDE